MRACVPVRTFKIVQSPSCSVLRSEDRIVRLVAFHAFQEFSTFLYLGFNSCVPLRVSPQSTWTIGFLASIHSPRDIMTQKLIQDYRLYYV